MSQIEILENRIAPAAIVTVTFENGALILQGDTGDHVISVTALDPSTFELQGGADTVFQMGDGTPTETLVFNSALKSLTATLGDGADSVSLIGLSISGDVKIDAGGGDNSIALSTVSVKRGLEITGGLGNDQIALDGTVSVKKDAVLTLGNGDNTLAVSTASLQVGGKLSYVGGDGADSVTAITGITKVGKDLSLEVGAGDSTVNFAALSSLSVGKNLIVDSSDSLSGEMSNVTLLSLSTRIGGDVRITDGAGSSTLMMATTGSTGKINVVSGEGDASATIGYLQLKTKAIEFDASESASSNLQVIGLGSTGSATAIKYTGGEGSDVLNAIGIGGASVIAELGNGDNSAILANIGGSVKTVQVTGGTGMDNVVVAALGGNVGKIDIETGDGEDNVVVAVVNGSAKNIDIESGAGTQLTTVLMANAKVNGKISVSNGTADEAAFNGAFLNSKIGSLDYTSEAAANTVSFGGIEGGFPLPGEGLPTDPEIDPILGSLSLVNGLTVTKGINVVTAGGPDTVSFDGAANVKIGKGIVLDLGPGENEVSGMVTNFVTKSIKVMGGADNDIVELGGTGNLGAVTLDLEEGENSAAILGDVVPLAIKSLSFTSTSAADATDSLTLARVISSGKVSATFGAGESTLRIEDSIINGVLDADTGAGADLVEIDTAATNAATVLKKTSIKLGDGDDTLTLGGADAKSMLIAKATFSANGGSGTNTLNNSDSNDFAKEPKFVDFVS